MSSSESQAYRKPIEVHEKKPHRLGVLVDLPGDCSESFQAGLSIAFDEAVEQGIGDRPVELVLREYVGHPWESGHPNVEAYVDLVENERVLGCAGPMTTDNCLSLLPHLDRHEVPSIGICGTQRYAGDYAFVTPNGGMADEPAVVAAWLVSQGHRKIALVREAPSQIGEEYTHYLRYEAAEHGFEIVMEQSLTQLATDDEIVAALEKLRSLDADCLVYFGLGMLSGQLTGGLKRIGWDPPRIMGTAFVGAAFSQLRIDAFDGWIGLDQFHEENPVHQHLLRRYEEKSGKPREFPNSVLTCGYDIGRAYALGLARMPTRRARHCGTPSRRSPACPPRPGRPAPSSPSASGTIAASRAPTT